MVGNTELIITIAIVAVSVIVPIVITAIVLFFVFRLLKGISNKKAGDAMLLQTGLPAQGKVLQMGTGGMTVTTGVQRSVQIQLVIEVHRQDGVPPYQARLDPLIPEIAISRITPGAMVPVKVDPQDPNKVAIDLPSMGFMV